MCFACSECSHAQNYIYFVTYYHRCIDNLHPRVCPLCRRAFLLERARKLHIDVASDESHLLLSPEDLEARRLAEKVADVSDENVSDELRGEAIVQVLAWLDNFPLDAVSRRYRRFLTFVLKFP